MDFVELQFVKMSPKAVVPTRATQYSIGLDLHSPDNYLIRPQKQVPIPTQIKLGILPEYYGRIASKSHLAIQNQMYVGAGVIDPDYTREIKVLLINNSKHYWIVSIHDGYNLVINKFSHNNCLFNFTTYVYIYIYIHISYALCKILLCL